MYVAVSHRAGTTSIIPSLQLLYALIINCLSLIVYSFIFLGYAFVFSWGEMAEIIIYLFLYAQNFLNI